MTINMQAIETPEAAADERTVTSDAWNGTAWVQLGDGKPFDILTPADTAANLSLPVIARSLARISRFGGHTTRRYSVLEHSLYVAELVPPEYKAAALLHDAHEALTGFWDVSSPAKQLFPGLKEIELAIDKVICQRFEVDLNLMRSHTIRQADLVMLATEKRDLMVESERPWGKLPPPVDRPFWWRYADISELSMVNHFINRFFACKERVSPGRE